MSEIRSFAQNQIESILSEVALKISADAPDDALRLLDKHQLRLAKAPGTACRAAVLAARALELTGDMDAAKLRAVEAQRLAIACDDALCHAESLELQGKVALRQRDLPLSIRLFERAVSLWQRADRASPGLARTGLARTRIGLAYSTLRVRQLDVARVHAVEAVRLARQLDQPRILGNALNAAGAVYQVLAMSNHPNRRDGDMMSVLDPCDDPLVHRYAHAGIAVMAEAAQFALASGSELDYVMTQSNSATFEILIGRADTALLKHEAMVRVCRQIGHKYMLASALQMVGWSLRVLGRFAQAEASLREALAIAKDAGLRDIMLALHYDFSLVYEQLGQPNQALFHLREYVRLRPTVLPDGASPSSETASPSGPPADVALEQALHEDPDNPLPTRPLVGSKAYDPSQLIRAETFINAHLRERISVADVARHAGVSVRNLQLAFTRHRSMSPLAFITAARLAAAHKFMLQARSEKMTVAQVADHWGFENVSRFSRAYKARYGKSPAETLAG